MKPLMASTEMKLQFVLEEACSDTILAQEDVTIDHTTARPIKNEVRAAPAAPAAHSRQYASKTRTGRYACYSREE